MKKLSEMKILPNPASRFCSIYSDVELLDSDYFIYNFSGQLVAKDKYDGKGIDISELTSGIYIFKIKSRMGNMESKLSVY